MANGYAADGWCPKGRKAEDGPIEQKYNLNETPSSNYLQRTEWNVRDSDATLVFTESEKLQGGSKRTVEFALKHKKPHLHLWTGMGVDPAISKVASLLASKAVARLNIAGSRGSKARQIGAFVMEVLDGAIVEAADG